MNPLLEVRNLSKCYAHAHVVHNLTFSLTKGALGCLLGPSGCGKTTTLRCLAGFEDIQAGSITINGQVVSSVRRLVPPEKRRLGMVFQDYALFPHLSVQDNIAFGLGRRKTTAVRNRVDELLALVRLKEAAGRFPHELSGGQQQRVALARALAPNPDLLLLDEPFSNLDVTLRERLSIEVRSILKHAGTTALMVTHNQHEAFAMADVIGVMREGCLEQWDSAYNLYHRPQNQFVADFVGEGVLLPGRVTGNSRVDTGLGTLNGRFTYPCSDGCPADVLIRPEDIMFDADSPINAKIVRKNFRGPNILYTLRLPSEDQVLALIPSHHNHEIGQHISISPQVKDIVLFEHAGQDVQTAAGI